MNNLIDNGKILNFTKTSHFMIQCSSSLKLELPEKNVCIINDFQFSSFGIKNNIGGINIFVNNILGMNLSQAFSYSDRKKQKFRQRKLFAFCQPLFEGNAPKVLKGDLLCCSLDGHQVEERLRH